MIPVLLIAAAGGYNYATQVRAGKHALTVASAPSPLQCGETTLTAHEIYRRVRNGAGADSLLRADAAAARLAERYDQRAAQISKLQDRMARAWEGNASDGAHAHLAPLFKALWESHGLLTQTTAPLRAQAESFHHAYKHVEAVPAEPPSSSLLNDVNPFHTDTDRKIDEYNTKASKNVQLYGEYNTASHANSAAMPKNYPTLPANAVAPIEMRLSTSPATGTSTTRKPPPGVPIGGSAISGTTSGVGGSPSAPSGLPVLTPATGTTPQDWTPDTRTTPPVNPVGSPATPPPGSGPVGGGPFVGVDGRAGGPGGRYGEPGRPGAGSGPRGGGGPVTRVQVPAAQSSAVSGRGGASNGTGPVGAGRKQDGEDDLEHKNKYLTTPDKDVMFGVDQVCAPPVIGERR